MAKIVKKRKRKLGSGGFGAKSSGGTGKIVTDLRPKYVPKLPPCADNCPSGNDIRGVLTTMAQAEKRGISAEQSFREAWDIFLKTNPFPSVCGRVCPHPCETDCNRKEKEGSLAINNIERFIGDFGIENNLKPTKLSEEQYTDKIAVVGAGPAGLS